MTVNTPCKGAWEFWSEVIARNAPAGVPNSLLCRERGRRGKFLFTGKAKALGCVRRRLQLTARGHKQTRKDIHGFLRIAQRGK
jgi:hypothetical protein